MFLLYNASNDMQYDIVKSPFDIDPRSKIEVDLSRSLYIQLDLSWQNKHNKVVFPWFILIICIWILLDEDLSGQRSHWISQDA